MTRTPEEQKLNNARTKEWQKKYPEKYKESLKKNVENRRNGRKLGKNLYCKGDYTQIENYEEGLKDAFNGDKWACHHRLENYYRSETLKDMKLYRKLPPDALIWVPKLEHTRDHQKSISQPLVTKWHKSVFDYLKDMVQVFDVANMPSEFARVINGIENGSIKVDKDVNKDTNLMFREFGDIKFKLKTMFKAMSMIERGLIEIDKNKIDK